MRISSNSVKKFSTGRSLFPVYDFSATMATTYGTYHSGSMASLKFLATENMPAHYSVHVYCGQTAEWSRIGYHLIRRGTPRPRRHCVRWENSCPFQAKGQSSPHYSARRSGSHFTHNPYFPLGMRASGSRGNLLS